MADKVTIMVLKVDLQCPCCYKKVKKILCKFPQVRDRMFDEKQNTVTITVVCCNPERLRDKLCCKGRKVIQSIEIKEPPKPKPPTPVPVPVPPLKPVPALAPVPVLIPAPVPVPVTKPAPVSTPVPDTKPAPVSTPVHVPKPAPAPVPVAKPVPAPVQVPKPAPAPVVPTLKLPEQEPQPIPIVPVPIPIPIEGPIGIPCCLDCYEGRPGGPCYQGYGRQTCWDIDECYGGYSAPAAAGPCNNQGDYSWRPVPSCDNYGYYGRRNYQCSPCNYFNEENPVGCAIM